MASFLDKYVNQYKAQAAAGNQSLMGKPYDYWLEKLAPSEKTYADMMREMLQNIGSNTRQGMGQASEMAAQYNLPVGTELALQGRVGLQGSRAAAEGTTNLEQYKDQATRQAWGNIMSSKQREVQFNAQLQQQQEQADTEFWGNLLGMLGQGAMMAWNPLGG